MRTKSVSPKYYLNAFNCPRCGVRAPQEWYKVYKDPQKNGPIINKVDNVTSVAKSIAFVSFINPTEPRFRKEWDLDISMCDHCEKYTVWENKQIIYPFETELPNPHEDMLEDVKGIYEEAALVYQHSPRASAALLRLGIETMIPQLEEYNIKKSSINNMIGELVKKDIPEHIQKGLDAIRIYGNEGIHAGEIHLNDDQENIEYLFELINYMTEELITKKKKLSDFYSKLPLGKREGILKRDKTKAKE
ncbi:DUF4145 domain-containing protein [Bacillus sp. ISL-57]|nr:DUF4145 domain-containing protein [Bacillus sp. ISL-57]